MTSVPDPTSSGEDRGAVQPTTREIPVVAAGEGPPPGAPPVTHGTQPAAQPAAGVPPLPPHPGAQPPAPVAPTEQPASASVSAPAFDGPRETGPVDFVPGLPGAGASAPPPPPPAAPSVPTGATAVAAPDGRTWPDTLEADAPAKSRRVRAPQDRATLLATALALLGLLLLELGLALPFAYRSLWSLVPLWSAFATVAALLALVGVAPAVLGRAASGSGAAWRIAVSGLVGVAVFWLLVVLPHADTNRGFVLTAALGALGAGVWMGPARAR